MKASYIKDIQRVTAKTTTSKKNPWRKVQPYNHASEKALYQGNGTNGRDGKEVVSVAIVRNGVRSANTDMHSNAKIYRHPNSPFYQAYFKLWDAKTARWKPATKSTRSTDAAQALAVARKFEEVALKAGGTDGESQITRQYIENTINSILAASGLPAYVATHTWADYSQAWLKMQKGRIGAGTYINYTASISSLTNWLAKDKNRGLGAFTGSHMQSWYEAQLASGKKPSTVNNNTKRLRAVFDRAQSEGFCDRNPVDLILKSHGGSDARETFTAEDIVQIIGLLTRTKQHDWLTVFLIGLCTGQRLQDCAQADWSQFRMEGETLVWLLTQGKTQTQVAIPIVEPLASNLKARRQISSPLVPSLHGTPSGGMKGLSNQFSLLLDASKIERGKRKRADGSKGVAWTGKTFHSLRHTTNSLLANAGVSDDVRRQILGHASTKMNARYTHLQIQTTLAGLTKGLAELAKK